MRCPSVFWIAVGVLCRREERGEHLFLGQELQELGVIGFVVEVFKQFAKPALLEPIDGGDEQPPGLRVELCRVIAVGMHEESTLFTLRFP